MDIQSNLQITAADHLRLLQEIDYYVQDIGHRNGLVRKGHAVQAHLNIHPAQRRELEPILQAVLAESHPQGATRSPVHVRPDDRHRSDLWRRGGLGGQDRG
jgi:hypothetical protein